MSESAAQDRLRWNEDTLLEASAEEILAELDRLTSALEWIAQDTRPLNLDGHFDPAEWWKHVASTRREQAIAALDRTAES